MSRNLIVCFDGTNNQFGLENTNVVRLIQVLHRDPALQRLYYDPGVGTLPEPGALTRIRKTLSKWYGLAFGAGLSWKIEEAYSYLMDYWEPGDQVFIFGFSRGAYSARVLAGMLHATGLLPRGNQNLVPYVMRLFRSIKGRDGDGGKSEYKILCDRFRWSFARPVPGCDDRRFPVHFLGVWDTVTSVGWIWDPVTFPYAASNPSIEIIRHAVSIDERRWFFRQNLVHPYKHQDVKEFWFPGVHSDVGGGYPETEGGLWRATFEWMLTEAVNSGLKVDQDRLRTVWEETMPPAQPWAEPQHESLTPAWWLAELFPKLRKGWIPKFGLFRNRSIKKGALLHKTALLRIRDAGYIPPHASEEFIEKVKALQQVPETMPFERGNLARRSVPAWAGRKQPHEQTLKSKGVSGT